MPEELPDLIGGDSLDADGGHELEAVAHVIYTCDYCNGPSWSAGLCSRCRRDEADKREWSR